MPDVPNREPFPSEAIIWPWPHLLPPRADPRRPPVLTLGLTLAFLLGAGAAGVAWRAAEHQRATLEEAVLSQIGLLADAVANSVQAELWLAIPTLLPVKTGYRLRRGAGTG